MKTSMNQNEQDCTFAALAGALRPVPTRPELRNKILGAISPRPPHLVLAEEGQFLPIFNGVSIKRLRVDAETETSLWRLDPGAAIPAHKHHADEECLIVSGSVHYGGRTLVAGDYLGALKGEEQQTISSVHGALLLIRGEVLNSNMLL